MKINKYTHTHKELCVCAGSSVELCYARWAQCVVSVELCYVGFIHCTLLEIEFLTQRSATRHISGELIYRRDSDAMRSGADRSGGSRQRNQYDGTES